MKFRTLTRSFSHRNFRLFFIGQSVSLTGTWMQNLAMSWVIYDMTKSSFQLGMVIFTGMLPFLLISLFAGVLTDRFDRRRLLLLTQTLSMLEAFILAALSLTGYLAVWHIYVLSVFVGIVSAFDFPARHAFLSDIVKNKKDIGNAIGLMASIFHAARLIGPTLAGFIISFSSAGVCFLVNGLSYLAILICLAAMQPLKDIKKGMNGSLRDNLMEGLRYAANFTPIRNVLLMICICGFAGSASGVLLPEFTTNVLHGGPRMLGWLNGASGLGAFFSAIWLASRKNILGSGRIIARGATCISLGLILLAFTTRFDIAFALMAVLGFGLTSQMASSNTLLQTVADEDKRGRVMSFYTLTFMGIGPMGSFLAGYLSTEFGYQTALLSYGLLGAAGALLFFLWLPTMKKIMRPIYVRLNIIPATTEVTETTSAPTPR